MKHITYLRLFFWCLFILLATSILVLFIHVLNHNVPFVEKMVNECIETSGSDLKGIDECIIKGKEHWVYWITEAIHYFLIVLIGFIGNYILIKNSEKIQLSVIAMIFFTIVIFPFITTGSLSFVLDDFLWFIAIPAGSTLHYFISIKKNKL